VSSGRYADLQYDPRIPVDASTAKRIVPNETGKKTPEGGYNQNARYSDVASMSDAKLRKEEGQYRTSTLLREDIRRDMDQRTGYKPENNFAARPTDFTPKAAPRSYLSTQQSTVSANQGAAVKDSRLTGYSSWVEADRYSSDKLIGSRDTHNQSDRYSSEKLIGSRDTHNQLDRYSSEKPIGSRDTHNQSDRYSSEKLIGSRDTYNQSDRYSSKKLIGSRDMHNQLDRYSSEKPIGSRDSNNQSDRYSSEKLIGSKDTYNQLDRYSSEKLIGSRDKYGNSDRYSSDKMIGSRDQHLLEKTTGTRDPYDRSNEADRRSYSSASNSIQRSGDARRIPEDSISRPPSVNGKPLYRPSADATRDQLVNGDVPGYDRYSTNGRNTSKPLSVSSPRNIEDSAYNRMSTNSKSDVTGSSTRNGGGYSTGDGRRELEKGYNRVSNGDNSYHAHDDAKVTHWSGNGDYHSNVDLHQRDG